jgi:ATP-dependent helicase HepA
VEQARQHLLAELDEELARMSALQEINPSVRDSEISALRQMRNDGLAYLDKAALRLEAIRVLVAG